MILLDSLSPVPAFEQIRRQLAAQISDGTLPSGTRLPTVRRLAADVGLAVNTVARAYRELETAGLVTARARAGTVVATSAEQSRSTIEAEAMRFASRARSLGIQPDDALALVTAALGLNSSTIETRQRPHAVL